MSDTENNYSSNASSGDQFSLSGSEGIVPALTVPLIAGAEKTVGGEQAQDDSTRYPSGVTLGLIILALCLSVFLIALDNSIIATAIPKISDEFHSLSEVGWYGSAYFLTTAALQLLFAKFYMFFSIKWVYLIAICIFELGSLICGVAQNSVTLIIGRAIAGQGAAGIMSGALIILAHSVPLPKRPMYAGMIGSMYGIASVAGPLLGGVFTDRATWRWCFFINLPIGAITMVVIAIVFSEPNRDMPRDENLTLTQSIMRFDPIGNLLFMPAIICLLLALQWGGTLYPWNNGRIIALFVIFGLLLLGFIFMQHRQQENATVPPRIMRNKSVWASCLFIFSLGSAFYLVVYYMPIWFQAVQGVSAIQSGIRNLPVLISVVILSIVSGAIVTNVGYYSPLMILGTALMSIGAGLLSTLNPETSSPHWIGYQILYGAGVGMGMQQPLMAIQNVLDLKDVPTGTAMITFLQTLGGAIFVSVGQSVFTNRLSQSLAIHVPSLDPRIVLSTGITNLQKSLPAEDLAGIQLSYNDALTQTFLVATALSASSILGSGLIPWRSIKGKAGSAAAMAA